MFANSDPYAIKFMVEWLKEFCGVPYEKFRFSIYLHDNLDEDLAKQYWVKFIGTSLDQFRKSYIVKNNPKRLRKVIYIYGVLRITVSDVNLHRKIMGWISGVLGTS